MPYINERGEILESRPLWRIGTITEFFQGLARMVALFFQTLFMMDSSSSNRSSVSRSSGTNSRRPPGPPRRRIGGLGSIGSGGTMDCPIPGGG
uniref:Putative selenoprotein k n=1 Tax=Amblyomma tuberculatum TaxID=48802 RepID=A0A6M2E2H8_9ACAR